MSLDQTGNANPKRTVKRMAKSMSLIGGPMYFRSAVSTHLRSEGQPIKNATKVLPAAYTTVKIGLRYCRSAGSKLSRIDVAREIK